MLRIQIAQNNNILLNRHESSDLRWMKDPNTNNPYSNNTQGYIKYWKVQLIKKT